VGRGDEEAGDKLIPLLYRHLRIVELRFFGGLSVDETAALLGTSSATVKREWSVAKVWLYSRLQAARGAT
jgi:DNA-directed RNA polymerase specialized sigma24 family protein